MNLNKKPLIMGIFNLSNESFYKKSIIDYNNDKLYNNCIQYCDIIDIGAESTHPGAEPLSAQEEIDKLGYAINYFKQFNLPISIDTYKSKTADFCIKEGIDIINDISGGLLDANMFNVIKKSNVDYILGHIIGNPKNMQINPQYNNIINDINNHFKNQIIKLTDIGFNKEKIILDPCIGFGKTLEHNIEIIKNISKLKELGYPILIGTSRKSMHNKMVNINCDNDLLLGTIVTNIISIINGADIIRVHDPKEFYLVRDTLNYFI